MAIDFDTETFMNQQVVSCSARARQLPVALESALDGWQLRAVVRVRGLVRHVSEYGV